MDASRFLTPRQTIPALRRAAQDCRGCELWRDATQAVFGAGPSGAELMLVGEQPVLAGADRRGDRPPLGDSPSPGRGGAQRCLRALVEDLDAVARAMKDGRRR